MPIRPIVGKVSIAVRSRADILLIDRCSSERGSFWISPWREEHKSLLAMSIGTQADDFDSLGLGVTAGYAYW